MTSPVRDRPGLLGEIGSPGPWAVAAVDTVGETFSIAGDHVGEFPTGRTFTVFGSTGNDGLWTVASAVYVGPNTVITVTGNVTSGVADGSIVSTLEFRDYRPRSSADLVSVIVNASVAGDLYVYRVGPAGETAIASAVAVSAGVEHRENFAVPLKMIRVRFAPGAGGALVAVEAIDNG